MTQKKPKSLFRHLLLPAGFVSGAILLLSFVLSQFLADVGPLVIGASLAIVLYVASRLLRYFEKPAVWGEALGLTLAGATGGALAMGLLQGIFQGGPGWPWTPLWALGAGVAMGLQRAWQPIHKAKKDAVALTVLLGGLALGGFAGYSLFAAFAPGGVASQRVLVIGLTSYGLHGARLLLRFAAEEREGRPGFVGWLRANALQNGVLVLVLVVYLAFRDTLAAAIPRFAFVEYGLAIAVFGFALQRLRARVKREESPLASTSEARAHERTVNELREVDYDAVAQPVAAFVETGRGADDYANAVVGSAQVGPEASAGVLEPLRAHREPPVLPPLPLRWSMPASALVWTGIALSAAVASAELFDAPAQAAVGIAVAALFSGAFAMQDLVRSRLHPWPAVGLAAGATLGLLLDVWFVLARGAMPAAILYVLLGVGALMIGASALTSWRVHRRLRRGEPVGAHEPAAQALEKQATKARRRVVVVLTGLFILFVPVRFLLGWLARRGWMPDLLPTILDSILGIAVWGALGIAAAAAVRYWGLTRHRPRIVAEEKARRAVRLKIHTTIMRNLERT